jgi:error-prone DNA polymerase
LQKSHYDLDLTLANIPQDDQGSEMICHADTIRVFSNKPGPTNHAPRIKAPHVWLVVEVAIVRPGPAGAIWCILICWAQWRRASGVSLKDGRILGQTLGRCFKSEAMKIAVAAGFTPSGWSSAQYNTLK